MVNFLVVDAPSAYNVILRRSSLSLFQVVVATYHMKLKFHVGNDVGEVAGDQLCTRKCYIETVKRVVHSFPQEKRRATNTVRNKLKIPEAMEESPEFKMKLEEELMSIKLFPNKTGFNTQIAT